MIKAFFRLLLIRLVCTHPRKILVNRFPKTGTTGRGKIWYIYWCPECKRFYRCSNFGKLTKASSENDFGFTIIGGNYK